MISLEELYDLISQEYNRNSENKSENTLKLGSFSRRIEFLPYCFELLTKHFNSHVHSFFAFESIKNIILKRGPIIFDQDLLNLFDFLYNLFENKINDILSNPTILNISSDSISIVIRFLLERNINNSFPIDQIHIFYEKDDNFKLLSLNIIQSLVDSFQEPFYHLEKETEFLIRKYFLENYIFLFFDASFNQITNENSLIIDKSLNVMKSCFLFIQQKINSQSKFYIYPQNFSKYYLDNKYLTNLLNIIISNNNDNIKNLVFNILIYLFSTTNSIFPSNIEYNQYFYYSSVEFSNILNKIEINETNIEYICSIFSIIIDQINPEYYFQHEKSLIFFDLLLEFSINTFQLGSFNTFIFILKIWNSISLCDLKYLPNLTEYLLHIIRNFFNFIKIKLLNEKFEFLEEIDIDDLYNFWKISERFLPQIVEIIDEDIKYYFNNFDENSIIHFCFFTKLITSKVSKFNSNLPNEYEISLFHSILYIVQNTNDNLIQLIETFNINILTLELILTDFLSEFQKKFFPNILNRNSNNIDDFSIFKSNFLVFFVRRLLTDLSIFTSISGCGNLILKIFYVIENLISKDISKQIIIEDSLVNSLLNRTIDINYEQSDLLEFKKTRTRLYYLYSRFLNSNKSLTSFLKEFDLRFSNLDFSDQSLVFGLYRDLYGAYSGSTISTIPKITYKFKKWFLENHLEHTTNLILIHSNCLIVVNAICHLWVGFFKINSNSRENNKSNLMYGIGIVLFRSSLNIAKALIENIESQPDQISILIKLIYFCLKSKIVHFGVMKYYGDNSLELIIKLFFDILKIELEFNNEKIIIKLISIIKKIIKLYPILVLVDENYLILILGFLKQVFLQKNKDTYEKSWNCLKLLFINMKDKQEGLNNLPLYQSLFVIILDNIINSNNNFVYGSGEIISYYYILDKDFCHKIFNCILNTYDNSFKDKILNIFENFLNNINLNEDFKKLINNFRKEMKKYPTIFTDDLYLAGFF